MKKINSFSNLIPIIVLFTIVIFFITSFFRGSLLVHKSEKELNPRKQIVEAQAKSYELKEIDTKTGLIRWQLRAKEGETENNLEGALIKDIKAEVFKDKEVVFELTAPYARANQITKEIYLFGEVIAKDKSDNFHLKSNQLALGMGTSIEAQKGFAITLKNNETVNGESALINDDQTKITVRKLQKGSFKGIVISGNIVYIERNKNSELLNATISKGGKIILKNLNDAVLSANIIKWDKTNEVEAIGNVNYLSGNKNFKAGHLIIKPNKNIYAKNNVVITHGQTKCTGNLLTYENNELVVITGNPSAYQETKQIIADKIVYNLNTSKLEAIGNVRTSIISDIKKQKRDV